MYEYIFGSDDPIESVGSAAPVGPVGPVGPGAAGRVGPVRPGAAGGVGPGGTPGNWWTVFGLVPDVFDHAVAGFALYRSPRRLIDPQLRELGMTRAGWLRASHFVFSQHCKSCRAVGLTEEQIAAIPAWSTASCFSPVERAVLAYTDALVLESGRVPDATFDGLRSHLSDEQILELTYLTMTYEMHAVISRALRLEYDDRDDPVVEVPGPAIVPAAER
jgi:alkylhydroperoxidase family enzyme